MSQQSNFQSQLLSLSLPLGYGANTSKKMQEKSSKGDLNVEKDAKHWVGE